MTLDSSEDGICSPLKRLGKQLLLQFEKLTKGYTGMLLALMSSFFSSGMAVTARLLQNSSNPDDNFNAFQILFLRMSLTIGIVLWVQHKVYARKVKQEEESSEPSKLPPKLQFIVGIPEVRHLLVIRALCGFFGVFGLYYSLNYLELSDATVLTFLTPVATSLLAWMFLGEKFTRSMALGGLVAFCGVILIARPVFLFQLITGSHDTSGVRPIDRLRSIGFSMLGVLGGGCAFVAIRSIGDRAHPTVNVQYFSTWCWLISLIALVYTGKGIRLPHTWSQACFIVILALCGFLTQLCMTGALTREKAAKVANITYTQIVWALLWDKVLWNNWPDVWSVLGGGLIIGSAIWVAMKKDVTVATVSDIPEVVPTTPQMDGSSYHVTDSYHVDPYHVTDPSYYSPDEESTVGMPLTPISKREAKVTIKSTGNDDDHLRLEGEQEEEKEEEEEEEGDVGEDVGLMHKLR